MSHSCWCQSTQYRSLNINVRLYRSADPLVCRWYVTVVNCSVRLNWCTATQKTFWRIASCFYHHMLLYFVQCIPNIHKKDAMCHTVIVPVSTGYVFWKLWVTIRQYRYRLMAVQGLRVVISCSSRQIPIGHLPGIRIGGSKVPRLPRSWQTSGNLSRVHICGSQSAPSSTLLAYCRLFVSPLDVQPHLNSASDIE